MALVIPLHVPACEPAHQVEFYLADGYSFTGTERDAIESVTALAMTDIRRVLAGVPSDVVVKVEASRRVIAETCDMGRPVQPNVIWWDVDPRCQGGVVAIVGRQLRPSLFHDVHHLVREHSVQERAIVDTFVGEGMATAFERDFAHSRPPWGVYGDEMEVLVPEVLAIPDREAWNAWLTKQKGTRRWAGQQVGTYLVDLAMRASHRTSADLVAMPTEDVLKLALDALPGQ